MNEELINNVRQWFHDKGIIEKSNPLKQLEKTQEELTETRDAAVKLDWLHPLSDSDIMTKGSHVAMVAELTHYLKDGIGDTLVTLIGVCEMYGFTLEECLQQAYDVISKRTGKMVDGLFIKDDNGN
jgi:hypothetical protein